ncbi:MAG: TIGR00282 family metallophosphoesterase [Chthonomonadales bacterium]
MRVLMVGDVVGRPGREAVLALLPELRSELDVDFVIADAENAAGGVGITPEIARQLLDHGGVDVLTLGNHAWAKREVYPYLNDEARILRPANYPPGVPGRGVGVYSTQKGAVAVALLQGRVFMDPVDCPFRCSDAVLEELATVTRCIFVEFHAEASSEKQAFGRYLDGRVSAVAGTHTHVQTADERLLPQGSAYITDLGMTGPVDSVIGMKCDTVLPRFLTLLPSRFEVASGPAVLSGMLIDVDEVTGRATAVTRLQVPFGSGSKGCKPEMHARGAER